MVIGVCTLFAYSYYFFQRVAGAGESDPRPWQAVAGSGSGSNPVEPVSNVAYRAAGRQRSRIQVYPNIRGSLLVTLETGHVACS